MPDQPARPTPPVPERDPAFLALLRCPLSPTRPPLTLSDDGAVLRCAACDCPRGGHDFPFTDGFPDLRPPTTGPDGAGEPEGANGG